MPSVTQHTEPQNKCDVTVFGLTGCLLTVCRYSEKLERLKKLKEEKEQLQQRYHLCNRVYFFLCGLCDWQFIRSHRCDADIFSPCCVPRVLQTMGQKLQADEMVSSQ